jgi:hypothetical protein
MSDQDTIASPTDVGWFTDDQQLTDTLTDARLQDTKRNSSMDDAQQIVAEFASSEEAGAWPSLDRAEVAARLVEIFAEPSADGVGGYRGIEQRQLNQCGPAAFLVMAIGRDPAAVARYATELFNTGSGSIGGFSVTASEPLLNADYSEMANHGSIPSQAEWMMLSTIRNSTEPFWQPEWVGDPNDEVAGMTRPEEVADWMRQTGIWSSVEDNGKWASNPGIPNATDLVLAEGTDIAMLIHANLINESTRVDTGTSPTEHSWSVLEYFPNHWVLLVSEVLPMVDNGDIQFTIWTWGERMRLRAPQQVFLDNYFGTVTASM